MRQRPTFELMTVVVIAAYRLMPSLSRINNQLISMRHQVPMKPFGVASSASSSEARTGLKHLRIQKESGVFTSKT